MLGLDFSLLVFPFSFSCMWLLYSIKKNQRTAKRVTALDSKTINLTTYGVLGLEKTLTVSKAHLAPVFDAPIQDRERGNSFDVLIPAPSGTHIEKKQRYIIEREKGEVRNESLFRSFFGFAHA